MHGLFIFRKQHTSNTSQISTFIVSFKCQLQFINNLGYYSRSQMILTFIVTYLFIKLNLFSKKEFHHFPEIYNSFMLEVVDLSWTKRWRTIMLSLSATRLGHQPSTAAEMVSDLETMSTASVICNVVWWQWMCQEAINFVQTAPTYINSSFLLHFVTVMDLGRSSSVDLYHIRKSED